MSARPHALRPSRLQNGCAFAIAHTITDLTPADCAGFQGGVVASGLVTAAARFLELSERLVQAKADQVARVRAAGGGSLVPLEGLGYSTKAAFVSDDFGDLIDVGYDYLYASYLAIANIYGDASAALVQAQRTFLLDFTAVYTVVFSVVALLVLLPRVGTLARQLRQRHALLLTLPPELLMGLPELRGLVGDVLAEAEAGGDASAASRAPASSSEAPGKSVTVAGAAGAVPVARSRRFST